MTETTQTAPEVQVPESDRKAALYDAFAPSLETLAKRYGLSDAGDPAALAQALEQEQQNAQARRSDQAQRLYQAWMTQAEDTRKAYPDFDLPRQLQDARFRELLKARVDVRTAYEVLNPQALREGIEAQVTRRLTQNPPRPRENGTAAQGTALTRQDIARMSRSERQAIIKRVQQGERITF